MTGPGEERTDGEQQVGTVQHLLCLKCDSSGSVEGPEQGWYEIACPACNGKGYTLEPMDAASPGVVPSIPGPGPA